MLIVSTILEDFLPGDCLDALLLLEGISTINRLKMLLLLLSKEEEELVKRMILALEEVAERSDDVMIADKVRFIKEVYNSK